MSKEKPEERSAEYWRQRYYDSVEKNDAQMQTHQAYAQTFKRGLMRLALAIENPDPRLQSALQSLREMLRDNNPSMTELHAHFEQLSTLLVRIDEENAARAKRLVPLGTLLITVLRELPAPRDHAGWQTLTQIQTQLQAVQRSEDLQPLLPQLSVYLKTLMLSPPALEAPVHAGTVPRQSFWSRFFSAEKSTVSALTKISTPATVAISSNALPAHEALLGLLEQLKIPKPLQPMRARLKEQLAAGLASHELPQMLEAIVRLVDQMLMAIEEEKRDLEKFLVQTTEHLGQMKRFIQDTTTTRLAARQAGITLQAAVQAQVQDISSNIERVADIVQLKTLVRTHLEAIHQRLKTYHDTEEHRNSAAEQEVEVLRQRMKELEREVSSLRERIQQEHGQALLDPLTGLFNRLAYDERLLQEYTRWKRYHSPLTVIIWDIDNFKIINDTYGHQAGDAVICQVAKILRSTLREADFVARYGGEEFIALLPETEMEQAIEPATKVRTLIAEQAMYYQGRAIPVTLSAGIAQFQGDDSPEQAFRRADVALYNAKAGGKNKVCLQPLGGAVG